MSELKKEWYVVNTYAGQENRVKENLERRVKTMGLEDSLFQIVVAEEKEIEYIDCGTFSEESVDYPEIAKAIALEVQSKECDKGIAICRSGIGMSIVANKFKGIRCAKCNDEEEARLSRAHNDSNVLALGADYIETDKAIRMVRMWIATEFEGGRHQERVKLIEEIENENMK